MPDMIIHLLALALLPLAASALTYESDQTLERQEFQNLPLQAVMETPDAEDDITVFDEQNRGITPPVAADLTRVRMEQGDAGWIATFSIADALPEDPGMPVNFMVYVDRDGRANAPDGVFRTGTDFIAMLLFGTATKWHAEAWQYDAAVGRWLQDRTEPSFTVSGTTATMTIPYQLLPPAITGSARFFSLTFQDAVTATDIAPGTGIPPVRTVQTSSAASSVRVVTMDDQELPGGVIVTILVLAAAAAVAAWKFVR